MKESKEQQQHNDSEAVSHLDSVSQIARDLLVSRTRVYELVEVGRLTMVFLASRRMIVRDDKYYRELSKRRVNNETGQ